jgi:hypothetical protein
VVEESEREVKVTLYGDRKDPEQACIQVARPGCATVMLEKPLGARRAVDGSQNTAPEASVPLKRFGPCRFVPTHGKQPTPPR